MMSSHAAPVAPLPSRWCCCARWARGVRPPRRRSGAAAHLRRPARGRPRSGVSDQFGFNVINTSDLNADGVDDILTNQGPRVLNDGASAKNGEVIVISGKDGSVIQTIAAPEPGTPGGRA